MPTSYRIIFEATFVCVYTVIHRLHNSSKGNRWCTVIENLAGTCHAEITISYCPSSHLTGHLLPVWKILPVETVLIMMLSSSPREEVPSTPTWPGTTSSDKCSRGYSTEYPPKGGLTTVSFELNWHYFPLCDHLSGLPMEGDVHKRDVLVGTIQDGEALWAIISSLSYIVHRDKY